MVEQHVKLDAPLCRCSALSDVAGVVCVHAFASNPHRHTRACLFCHCHTESFPYIWCRSIPGPRLCGVEQWQVDKNCRFEAHSSPAAARFCLLWATSATAPRPSCFDWPWFGSVAKSTHGCGRCGTSRTLVRLQS